MLKKQLLGQNYTTNAEYIVRDLINIFPKDAKIIEPFAGNFDLINLFSTGDFECYDIDPQNSQTIKQDTLINPPNYINKWIITNPPYLARNKNKDKTIYNLYQVEDLYEASILSLIGCDGGILILPLNFFCGKNNKIRKAFLSKYIIIKLKIFEEQVFKDTSYTVCAFCFIKKDNDSQELNATFYPVLQNISFNISLQDGYRIGNDFYKLLEHKSNNIKATRLLIGQEPNTKIFLRTIDSGSMNGRIKLEIKEEPFYGKNTDRAFATISLNKTLSLEHQKIIVNTFNTIIEDNRKTYHSLFLTNFRNSTKSYARKRISFDDAYRLIEYIVDKIIYSS